MTGWRIGYGLAPESVIGAINKLQSHSTSNPTSIAQKAAVEKVKTVLLHLGAKQTDTIESPILGAEGNREFLLYAVL